MTASNRTALKALFETGDTILQSSFVDLIDSFLDLVETSSQSIASPIVFQNLVTFASAVTFNTTASAPGMYLSTLNGGDGSGFINTNAILSSTNYSYSGSARGTTRASALDVSGQYITILDVVSAGTNDGVVVGKGTAPIGYVQHIINSTSATAKIYCLDKAIDGTSVVQLFPNQRMTIYTVRNTSMTPGTFQYTMIGAKASV